MKNIQYAIADESFGKVATITFDEPDSAVNTMSTQWNADMTELVAILTAGKASLGDSLKGIILASNKKTFFAGADLKGTMRNTHPDPTEVFGDRKSVV